VEVTRLGWALRVRAGQDSALHVPATQRKVAHVVAKIGGVGMSMVLRDNAERSDARPVEARSDTSRPGNARQGAFRRAKYRVGRNEAAWLDRARRG
jgi:hypothetical protein